MSYDVVGIRREDDSDYESGVERIEAVLRDE